MYIATMYEMVADELRNIIMSFGCLAINPIDVNFFERNRKYIMWLLHNSMNNQHY